MNYKFYLFPGDFKTKRILKYYLGFKVYYGYSSLIKVLIIL